MPKGASLRRRKNKHFISDFGLRANDLVVVREEAGGNRPWEEIPKIWELASNPERLSRHVKNVVDRFLGNRI